MKFWLFPVVILNENFKVWTDFKTNTKKQLVANKKHMEGTGGGPAKEKFIYLFIIYLNF